MNNKNKLTEELENGNLYKSFLELNLTKINELQENAKTDIEKEFYSNLHRFTLQTKQANLIEKGVF